jgi:hypothetical protein
VVNGSGVVVVVVVARLGFVVGLLVIFLVVVSTTGDVVVGRLDTTVVVFRVCGLCFVGFGRVGTMAGIVCIVVGSFVVGVVVVGRRVPKVVGLLGRLDGFLVDGTGLAVVVVLADVGRDVVVIISFSPCTTWNVESLIFSVVVRIEELSGSIISSNLVVAFIVYESSDRVEALVVEVIRFGVVLINVDG